MRAAACRDQQPRTSERFRTRVQPFNSSKDNTASAPRAFRRYYFYCQWRTISSSDVGGNTIEFAELGSSKNHVLETRRSSRLPRQCSVRFSLLFSPLRRAPFSLRCMLRAPQSRPAPLRSRWTLPRASTSTTRRSTTPPVRRKAAERAASRLLASLLRPAPTLIVRCARLPFDSCRGQECTAGAQVRFVLWVIRGHSLPCGRHLNVPTRHNPSRANDFATQNVRVANEQPGAKRLAPRRTVERTLSLLATSMYSTLL